MSYNRFGGFRGVGASISLKILDRASSKAWRFADFFFRATAEACLATGEAIVLMVISILSHYARPLLVKLELRSPTSNVVSLVDVEIALIPIE